MDFHTQPTNKHSESSHSGTVYQPSHDLDNVIICVHAGVLI